MSKVARLVGLGIAGLGVAHLAKPEIFEQIVVTAFPTNTREHIYAAATFDIVLGLGLVAPSTRKLAVAGLVGYAGYFSANAINRNLTPTLATAGS